MAPNFDVIVVGSGFGAAVAAIDQAGKGKTVFILERGVSHHTPRSRMNTVFPFPAWSMAATAAPNPEPTTITSKLGAMIPPQVSVEFAKVKSAEQCELPR